MNAYRNLFRIWIAAASFVGFITGWVFIARAAETEAVRHIGNTAVTMPNLPPVPTVEGLAGNPLTIDNVQTFTVNPVTQSQQSFSQPMRTGGS